MVPPFKSPVSPTLIFSISSPSCSLVALKNPEMAALNIESIAASLRNCSLNNGREAAPPHQPPPHQPPPPPPESQEVAVELNSDTAFPNHWKQCLDMRTGELFYVNGKNGERRTEVPRIESFDLQASYHSSEDYKSDYAGDIEEEEDDDGDFEEDNEDFFGVNSRNSYSSSSADSDAGGENGVILVVAGCKSCFMYFMVPKLVDGCPKCGGCLLHFG